MQDYGFSTFCSGCGAVFETPKKLTKPKQKLFCTGKIECVIRFLRDHGSTDEEIESAKKLKNGEYIGIHLLPIQ